MTDSASTVSITIRVPGCWESPADFAKRLGDQCTIDDGLLRLADGAEMELNAVPSDEDFLSVFASSCRRPPSLTDQKIVENFTVNLCITGEGGSAEKVIQMLMATYAVVQAGGGGIFIDNSGVAMGSDMLSELLNDTSSPHLIRELIGSVGAETELYSMGMHMFGQPDIVLDRGQSQQQDFFLLLDVLRVLVDDSIALADGQTLDHPALPALRVCESPSKYIQPNHPMHNPFGRWRVARCDA